MMLIFKVWNANRSSKKMVFVNESTPEICKALIANASAKLGINGVRLVLESDGTEVDDDEVLKLTQKEVFLLLQDNEQWHTTTDEVSYSSDSTSTIDEDLSDVPGSDSSRSSTPNHSTSFNENQWISFKIPFEKISSSAINYFNKGIRCRQSIKDVIHLIADEMMEQSTGDVPNRACKIIANKLVAKFPKVFQDCDDDGTVIGDGAITTFSQIKERLKYIKASRKRSIGGLKEPSIPANKRRKLMSLKSGCLSWQPELPTTSDEEIENNLKTVDFELFDNKTKEMMDVSYPKQRLFLNNLPPPSLQDIKDKWPILLCQNGIYFHYEKLMGHSITNLTNMLLKKANKFLSIALNKKWLQELPTKDNDDEIILIVLKIISKYFQENLDVLYSTIVDEAFSNTNTPTTSPTIRCLQNDHETKYYIVMENCEVNQTHDLKNALQQTFALYYILNLEYPKAVSSTMELMQTYFLKIHPQQGTRNRKSNSKIKIASLLNKLRDSYE